MNKATYCFEQYLFPLFLILVCPPFAMILWYVNTCLDGSFFEFVRYVDESGFFSLLNEAWFVRFWGSSTSWSIIAVFAGVQLLFMKYLPGKKYFGTISEMGNTTEYKDNGLMAYLVSFVLFFVASIGFDLFAPSIVYDHFGDILASLNVLALVFCLFLYVKGRFFPSTSDSGSSGSFIFDYYWGYELNPNVFGFDIKMFTNCRFGMIGWALTVTSFAFAQVKVMGRMDLAILVSTLLIVMYLLKFFIWESGYMRSMDISVDRAGFYICWGCLVWVPAVYTSPVLFAVHHPVNLSLVSALGLFTFGTIAIWINYWADFQRQLVRATQGNCTIWGKTPLLIFAPYKTQAGTTHSNVLLASGFWGLSRHFHYLPELLAAFIWSSPAGFSYLMPFFYFVFLCILLVHRAFRDDKRCQAKYAAAWDEYRRLVPHKIIPYVF